MLLDEVKQEKYTIVVLQVFVRLIKKFYYFRNSLIKPPGYFVEPFKLYLALKSLSLKSPKNKSKYNNFLGDIKYNKKKQQTQLHRV